MLSTVLQRLRQLLICVQIRQLFAVIDIEIDLLIQFGRQSFLVTFYTLNLRTDLFIVVYVCCGVGDLRI